MNIKNLQDFSLEQQVSELFIVKISSNNLTKEEKEVVENIAPGGFLFSNNTINNIKTGKELCEELERIVQRSKRITPFFAVEHEGGEIFALPQEATPIPSAMAIGATGSTNFAYTAAYITALELRAIGINMNFSPLIEPANLNNCGLSRSRNFWDNSQDVEQFALKYIRGLRNGGIISVAKYFPGYFLKKENDELEVGIEDIKRELPTLRRIILSKVDGLMISNVTVISKKQKKVPAFLSKEIVREILINDLSYQGLLVTEPLSENKTLEKQNLEEIATEAIEVGNDILVIDEKFEKLYKLRDTIVKEARRNPLLARRIKRAFGKVIKKKMNYLRYFRKPTLRVIGCKKHRNEVEKITEKSIGLVFDEGLLPLKPQVQNIIVLVLTDTEVYKHILSLAEEFGFKKAGIFLIEEGDVALITTKIRKADVVVIFSQNLFNKVKERRRINEIIERNEKNILVSVGDPYDVMFVRRPRACIVTYSPDFYSIKAAMKVITGKLRPTGKIPKSLIETVK